jgi:UDP-N-acetyl-D-glucosamine/UDP-N-acetyl-D-galactosamine dehydrogenase
MGIDGVARDRRLAVIGLGYVGLPVAVAFGRAGWPVVGFDIDRLRIAELRDGRDRTREVRPEELAASGAIWTDEPEALRSCDLFILTVPTPIDRARRPDLSHLIAASETVGRALKHGDLVVFESTVFPGATEEICGPVLAAASGLQCGRDFALAYSPERINPGDAVHRFETITKVVAAQTPEALDLVARLYGSVVTAGIHRAPSIRVAEAAKVIENTQRDLNIALMNELSALFERLELDTSDVLAAAGTKWNFGRYTPGLVGGHCIGVDPYYLTHCAERAGFHPEIILAGRRTNDGVPQRIARECVRRLLRKGQAEPRVTVLGLTFKEDVPDLRNSKVAELVAELASFGCRVQLHDPTVEASEARRVHGLDLMDGSELEPAQAVILAVPHRSFIERGWSLVAGLLRPEGGLVMDVRARLDRALKPEGVELWRM